MLYELLLIHEISKFSTLLIHDKVLKVRFYAFYLYDTALVETGFFLNLDFRLRQTDWLFTPFELICLQKGYIEPIDALTDLIQTVCLQPND